MADQTTSVEAPTRAERPIEYGSFYYRHDCGIPYERNEHWLEFFDRIAEQIVREFHPSSVLDAGCAMGFLVEGLRKRGVEASGIDVSEYAIAKVHESVAEHCRVGSLTEPLGQRYDLVTCIEVVEHIPATDADVVIANLCAASDRLLLSTSPLDYGEATHLNVRPPEEWSAALAREGFLRDLDHDLSYLTPWAALYARREEPLAETVRAYDRSWWRLRHEVTEVRGALLKAQDRLAELESDEGENRPELTRELDRSREEVLRLRDLVIGKDAELGAARGEKAALEAQTRTVTGIARSLQSRMPRFMRLAGALLRGLRKAV
jgi:SAM-dependent methyltransferase